MPITPAAKEISAFVTLKGFYQYTVMLFGKKNALAAFQHMINNIIRNLEGCETYNDDVIVFGSTWEEHLSRVKELFCRLKEANLMVNLVKSEFGHAYLTYLGHIVGQGEVRPVIAKVDAIINYSVPTTKRQLMRFFEYGRILSEVL